MRAKRLTPKETVHSYCHYCIQSKSDSDVENCGGHFVCTTGKPCPFYEYRKGNKKVPIKVFRQFCLECMGGNNRFVAECETFDCLCWPFRLGTNPARFGVGGRRKLQSGYHQISPLEAR